MGRLDAELQSGSPWRARRELAPGTVYPSNQGATTPGSSDKTGHRASGDADAAHGEISIGDLLTTSPTIGCAMKASDPNQRHGSIIGKALSSLKEGEGLVNMLIALY